jgi:hypothetical protein
MQKTALTLFGALLFSGMAVQIAAASKHHHLTKVDFARHHADYSGYQRPTWLGCTSLMARDYRADASLSQWIGRR